MPDALETRVLDGVKAVALTASGANVPSNRHYRRDVLAYSADRDSGPPAVVVARTPGRDPTLTYRLRWKEWVYHATALLIGSTGGAVVHGAADEWRVGWVPAFEVALKAARQSLSGVSETHYALPDALTQLDLSLFDGAGLWVSRASVVVTVRLPL